MSSVTPITGEGADMIGKPAHSPIQSIWRWPCIKTAYPARGLSCRSTQLPLISAADALRQGFDRPGIFHEVMVQPDQPAGLRILLLDNVERLDLLGRDHAERVGKGEMRVGIGIEQDDAESVRLVRRYYHGKDLGP